MASKQELGIIKTQPSKLGGSVPFNLSTQEVNEGRIALGYSELTASPGVQAARLKDKPRADMARHLSSIPGTHTERNEF